jgi:SAM-dependent methyltransferase
MMRAPDRLSENDVPMQQRVLAADQIQAFYHDEFVEDQVRHFVELLGSSAGASDRGVVVDVGGGCGYFAEGIARRAGYPVRVLDSDPASVAECAARKVPAVRGDALAPEFVGDEDVVCFNLILHHLVGRSAAKTRELQRAALAAWRGRARAIFVNEYIYESFVGNVSGALIYWITSNRVLSWLGRTVAKVVPAFRANTFGVGVRFRAHEEWVQLFRTAGYEVVGSALGTEERIKLPLRVLLIKHIRRDSFLLRPSSIPQANPA